MTEEKEFSPNEAEQFRKGFNDGYVLQKHSPEVLKQILESQENPKLPFLEGINAGSQQYKKEQLRELLSRKDEDRDLGLSR